MGLFLKEESGFVYNKVAKWLDDVLSQDIPEDVVSFCFNLYDDGNSQWAMELVGTQRFDTSDADWPCEEVTDFGTRNMPLTWSKAVNWDVVLEEVISVLSEYLNKGKQAKVLKAKTGVGVGFVDGDVKILYS